MVTEACYLDIEIKLCEVKRQGLWNSHAKTATMECTLVNTFINRQ